MEAVGIYSKNYKKVYESTATTTSRWFSRFVVGEKELESTIAFATIEFCVSLQEEEVTLIVIEGLNMFWKETLNHCIPHMMMTLKRKFKGGNNM